MKDTKKLDDAIDEMTKDPVVLKRTMLDRARREHPDLTEEQLEELWKQAVHQLGL